MLERIAKLSERAEVSVAIGSAQEGDGADLTAARAAESGLGPVHIHRDPGSLVKSLVDGDVDAAIRGTLPAHATIPPLLEAVDAPAAMRVALMDLGGDRTFLLAPVGIDEGRDMAERWTLLQGATQLARIIGWEPRVAVMSMGRAEDQRRGEAIALSHRECEALRSAAETEGVSATCTGIQLELAVEGYNVIIAPDGVTGNLVFRALHLVAGHESWGAVAMGLRPLVYVDTSREKADYLGALHLARVMAIDKVGRV